MAKTPFLIDVTRPLGRFLERRLPTGVDRVILAYVAHYQSQALALIRWQGRGFVLSEADSRFVFETLTKEGEGFDLRQRGHLLLGLAKSCLPPSLRGQILLKLDHGGLETSLFTRIVEHLQLRPVIFLHDLIPILYPEYSRPEEDIRHRQRLQTVFKYAKGIITNSQLTANHVKQHARRQGQPLPQLIPAALAPGFDRIGQGQDFTPPGEPYFVMLGTIEPRKNHWLILHVWRELTLRLGDQAPKLVVIGQRGWECENVVDLLERCPHLKKTVEEKRCCSDAELRFLLRHARALLFPSFAEGFGLPLVEALALGVPVIASELEVFKEMAGEIPDYLNPLDGLGWERMIEAYTPADSPSRAAQIDRIQSFKPPTWQQHFALVDQFLASLHDRTGNRICP